MAELGELIDLGDALDRPIGTYSGGMKGRLDLAARSYTIREPLHLIAAIA